MARHEAPQTADAAPFHPVRLILIILLILFSISMAAQWYGENVTMPRYCQYPGDVIGRVRQVLNEKEPAGEGDRKPYIIAARLMFLVPRHNDEKQNDYILRLQQHIDKQCR
ncbi:MAG: hypothetical protein KUF77_06445 [Candidatus Thiodiazotropha sp. (ex Lucina aurantia)]|uniref:Uncharacterized protein n=2 Tax=Candidatus Thiodiazotropha TaxID=1913444 RepID=A0A7Z0VQE2_9GAMM|nr:hypothetical protein [Candidatus Thiodiazotropha endolucinida]MBT3012235.1 hypothetical protein [Candidatus Thiodiazotropha sp. (ex Lucina pensylvanica)]MBT3016071.1 hypothetical protein [Candidatus Thiodiazotropha taylori]MBT3038672.1 hypothetical protein [Candidatus Thiodiazotropha sp. (ex Codakia orbicularis)]MBV2102648.1 hypothetical protein [Candidatus Thiodiazotropha sp. (ex Lucina aurantia)]MBT3023022.1 hypothetical protein [Candidatus Thiodiazotropha taylori]